MLVPFAADSPYEQNGAFFTSALLPCCPFCRQLASVAGERGAGGRLGLPARGNRLQWVGGRGAGGGVQQMLASAGTRGPSQHGGGEGVCEEVPAQAALQLQEGGPRVDLGKSSAGGEPTQLSKFKY